MPTVSDVQCRMVGDRWQGGVAGLEVKGRLGLGFGGVRVFDHIP
ncbi:MAG TPA: hypothetical protein V6D13_17405 [Halomicronema sp.]